jgi:para-aminobenzoate synthetase component 1
MQAGKGGRPGTLPGVSGCDVGAAAVLAALPPGADAAVVHRDGTVIVGVEPDLVVAASGEAALATLDRLPPGWFAGYLAYDLGRAVERIEPRATDDPALPDLVLARFPARLELDVATGHTEVIGEGEGATLLRRAAAPSTTPAAPRPLPPFRSNLDREAFEAGVRSVLGSIVAGDCYQVNLCRRVTAAAAADPVALFTALAAGNPAPHAAFLRFAGDGVRPPLAVVSASPERFLAWRGAAVETRPIKGTARDPGDLAASEKDRAENVMIVDLARNDLGRVCEPGSITVPSLCAVEPHPGLHHLVSTVQGRRRPSTTLGDLVRATFPPASVTGAPKPRVLQIIEDLEPDRRGVYCGAIGWVDTERDAGDLNVAIRTFVVRDGRTELGLGAGIVADSDPGREWEETELKAARLLAVADGADVPVPLAVGTG